MSNLIYLFQDAIRRDDVCEVISLVLTNQNLLESITGSTWSENPILTAHKHGSFRVVRAMAELWPELASIKDQNGNTAMCTISAKGDAEIVKLLGRLNPFSCLVEDNSKMIPLQLAAVKGHPNVIRELVAVCPESLGRETSNQESPFHLAVNNLQFDALRVLVEESKKLNQEHLLNKKDEEGNTILHIAISKKMIGVVNLLLLESSNNRSILVNTRNKRGLTALDLCYANSQDMASKEISRILHEVGAAASRQSPQLLPTRNCMDLTRLALETRNVLLVVLAMIAGSAFTVTCNLPAIFLKEVYLAGETLQVEYLISGRFPTLVYLMVFNSAAFMTAMLAILVLIWPLKLRKILLFPMIFISIVYIILVDKITPKFAVRVGTRSISSIALVWSLALGFSFSATAILLWENAVSSLCRFID